MKLNIKSITIEEYNDYVYDISVEKNHNFIAGDLGSILISNSIYPDCTNVFNNSMAQAIKTGTSTLVDVVAPFIDQDKNDICGIGLELGVDFSKTWTCYVGKDKPCGMCGSCVERTEAFISNNTLDPLYTSEDWNIAVKYYNKVKK